MGLAAGWREALRVLAEHRGPEYRTELLPTYRAAISACRQDGKWRQAIAVLNDLRSAGGPGDTRCYSDCMAACRRAGFSAVALRLYDEHRQHSNAPPDPFTTSNAIAAYEETGSWESALTLLRRLEAPNVVCSNAAIAVCARSRDGWRMALQLLEELEVAADTAATAKKGSRRATDIRPNARTFASALFTSNWKPKFGMPVTVARYFSIVLR